MGGQMVMSPISSAYLPYFMHCPEVRVSHRRSCALTDIHRDITGGSQGHYQARILTVSLHNLPIPWSPLSGGPAFFALIYQFLDISTICECVWLYVRQIIWLLQRFSSRLGSGLSFAGFGQNCPNCQKTKGRRSTDSPTNHSIILSVEFGELIEDIFSFGWR